MRLKSIKLAGFKSFVDATTVPFTTNMTAIVGPNGCGKSNIIDAVRWVMGESSAKNLRGENMTDVIFNGSSGRQPVGQASIELLFDNSEGRLTGEYAAFSEISIRRKVTREGLSQYYLNGTKCRRRDVTDIFLGTGMGPRSYAIIEQGMISKLIESKPEDLRVYLEEAAGISKYKERRRETENRMRRTQDNLDRLSDIREELGKQLQHLKKQANAAERYAEYKQEERLSSAKLNALRWQAIAGEAEQKVAKEREYEIQIEDAVLGKNTNENQIDSLRTKIEQEQERFNSIQAKYYQSGAEIASLEQKLQYEKNRLHEQKNMLDILLQEVASLEIKITEDNEQLALLDVQLDDLQIDIEEREAASEQLSRDLDQQSRALDAWQSDWEAFNHQSANTRQSAELAQSHIQQHENRLRELTQRAEKLLNEKTAIELEIADVDMDVLKEDAVLLEEQMESISDEIASIEPKIHSLSLQRDQLKKQQATIYTKISEERAVLASLNTLQQSIYGDQSDRISSWSLNNGFADCSRLLDQLQVEPGWEQAVEQVLSGWLDAFVLANEMSNHVKDVSFLSQLLSEKLSMNFVIKEPAAGSAISSECHISGSLNEKIKGGASLSGMLCSIFTAETLEEALEKRCSLTSDQSIITKDGYWIGADWLRFYYPDEAHSGVLVRAQKIQSLESSIIEHEHSFQALDADIEQASQEAASLEQLLYARQQQLLSFQAEARKVEQFIVTNQTKMDQYQLRLLRSKEDLEEVNSAQEETSCLLDEARTIWQEAMEKLEIISERRDELLSEKESILSKLEQIRNQARDAQNNVHQKQLARQQQENQIMLLKQNVQRLSLERAHKNDKITTLSNSEEVDDSHIQDMQIQLEGLLETRLTNEHKLTDARQKLEQAVQFLREEEANRSGFENSILAAREALSALRLEIQALRINQRNLTEKIQADDFSLQEILELLSEEDKEAVLIQHLEQLAAKITRLGSINLAAIEEFKIQSERKEHLDAQNEDLTDALETLLAAIRKIDKETRIRFKETFDQVNEGLQRLFPKIFGGGNAYLELTDDNLLETGVQIIARPPGKKNATIHLLSGGEKSLTAIALIFAIFELNPAPFCMLDEVDAPLDDANVGRFANIVKEMSSQVQFIYISHNKVSMERADQLMGVTMHEPGVSRLVSVDIEQAAAMVESL
jgi:chromosome segregation protein